MHLLLVRSHFLSHNPPGELIEQVNRKGKTPQDLQMRHFCLIRESRALANRRGHLNPPREVVISAPSHLPRLVSTCSHPISFNDHHDPAPQNPNLDFHDLPLKSNLRKIMLAQRDASGPSPRRHQQQSLMLISLILLSLHRNRHPKLNLHLLYGLHLFLYDLRRQRVLSPLSPQRLCNLLTATARKLQRHTSGATMQLRTKASLPLLKCSLISIQSPS